MHRWPTTNGEDHLYVLHRKIPAWCGLHAEDAVSRTFPTHNIEPSGSIDLEERSVHLITHAAAHHLMLSFWNDLLGSSSVHDAETVVEYPSA
jgi:hypothetical protein